GGRPSLERRSGRFAGEASISNPLSHLSHIANALIEFRSVPPSRPGSMGPLPQVDEKRPNRPLAQERSRSVGTTNHRRLYSQVTPGRGASHSRSHRFSSALSHALVNERKIPEYQIQRRLYLLLVGCIGIAA